MLQHRGKDGFGISGIVRYNYIENIKHIGEIKDIINEKLNNHIFSSCIGHLRYSTSGKSLITKELKTNELQPLNGYCNDIGMYNITHNGNIPNIDGHDTSFINKLLMENENEHFENKLINIMNTIPAAYSIVILTLNGIYAMRDRFGIRPLCFGKDNQNNYYISSENSAFSENINYIDDINQEKY